MKKRRLSYFIIIILISSNLCSCNIIENTFLRKTTKIGFLSDKGVFKENNFNEQSYKGVLEAVQDFNIKSVSVENDSKETIEKNLRKLTNKTDLIIVTGEDMNVALNKISKDFSDKIFAIIDGKSDNENVKSVKFKEQEGAFLVGVLAGRLTKSNKVGFIGGDMDDVLERFYTGYAAGVNNVNKIASESLLNGETARYTMDFKDKDKAYNIAKELYEDGCDIIFQAVGEAGEGVFKAAMEENKYVIGVDQDQAEIYKEYSSVIMSSMIKRVDKATYEVCKEVATGTFKSGKNYITTLGLKDGYIDIAPSTEQKISKNLMNEINDYKNKIIEEKFIVPEKTIQIKEYLIK